MPTVEHAGIEALRRYAQPPAPIANVRAVANLLQHAWSGLAGSDPTRMRADKIWRIEDATWERRASASP